MVEKVLELPNSIAFKYYKPILKNYCENWETQLNNLRNENDMIYEELGEIKRQNQEILRLLNEKLNSTNQRTISRENRYKVLKRQNWKCNNCGAKLKYSQDSPWEGEIAHIDHIFPYSKRKNYHKGEAFINDLDNLQALCPKCNKEKAAKEVQ